MVSLGESGPHLGVILQGKGGGVTPRVTAPRVTNPSDASGVHTYSQTLAAAAVEELHCAVGVPQDDDVIISRDCSASEKKAS